MNPDRRVSLAHLTGREEGELNVDQLMVESGVILMTSKFSGSVVIYNILQKQRMDVNLPKETLIQTSLCYPFLALVHQTKKNYCIMRLMNLHTHTTRNILMEEIQVHALLCGEVGAIVLSSANKVYYISQSEEDERLVEYPGLSVLTPVRSLCHIRGQYCLIANQYEGNIFNILTGKIVLHVQLSKQAINSLVATFMFDSLAIAISASSVLIWILELNQPIDTSPKVIVTETMASSVVPHEDNLVIGYAGGMIALHSREGELLKVIASPHVNPLTSPIAEQLQARVRKLIVNREEIFALFASGELRRFHTNSEHTMLKKSSSYSIVTMALLTSELCIITKSNTNKSDINILFFQSTLFEKPKLEKKKRKLLLKHSSKEPPPEVVSFPNQPRPFDEDKRLDYLKTLQILKTKPELEKITSLCAKTLKVSSCVVNSIDNLKCLSSEEAKKSFCTYAIKENNQIFQVSNTLEHPIFRSNPFVIDYPFVRFYAGVPLQVKGGLKIGTLCLMDSVPRILSKEEKELILDFADTIVTIIKERQKILSTKPRDLLSFTLQTPMDNIENGLNSMREQNKDDPLFEQMLITVAMSKQVMKDSLEHIRSNQLASNMEPLSKINILELFNYLKKAFQFVPKSTHRTWNLDDVIVDSVHAGFNAILSTEHNIIDSEYADHLPWIIDIDCPEYIVSYPKTVFRVLMDLIGGAWKISHSIEIVFLKSEAANDYITKEAKEQKKKEYLKVEVTINDVTIEEDIKKLLFIKQYDENVTGFVSSQLLLYCFIIQRWMDKLNGICNIEEMEEGFVFSIEIPTNYSKEERWPSLPSISVHSVPDQNSQLHLSTPPLSPVRDNSIKASSTPRKLLHHIKSLSNSKFDLKKEHN